jgi:UDP-N-acetyl-2-amino-2-deoxyglucuronate dehydrogenase
VDGLRLVRVFDVDPQRSELVCSESGAFRATTLDEFFGGTVDLVCICTPNATHVPLATLALDNRCNVLLEHPFATNTTEASALCEKLRRSDRRLFFVRQRRFLPGVQNILWALRNRQFGLIHDVDLKLLWSRTSHYFKDKEWRGRRESGGVIVNQASHFLDMLLYLFGEFSEVQGVRGNLRHELPVEDTASGTILFESGVKAQFLVSVAWPDGYNSSSLRIRGETGVVQLGGKALEVVNEWTLPSPPVALSDPNEGDHASFLRRVVRSLRGEDVEIVSAEDGFRATRFFEKITDSLPLDNALLSQATTLDGLEI